MHPPGGLNNTSLSQGSPSASKRLSRRKLVPQIARMKLGATSSHVPLMPSWNSSLSRLTRRASPQRGGESGLSEGQSGAKTGASFPHSLGERRARTLTWRAPHGASLGAQSRWAVRPGEGLLTRELGREGRPLARGTEAPTYRLGLRRRRELRRRPLLPAVRGPVLASVALRPGGAAVVSFPRFSWGRCAEWMPSPGCWGERRSSLISFRQISAKNTEVDELGIYE